ncbi:MAG: DUF4919 domain-containing protein [Patescibacteria group bacterium]|nr:DUF4919 domain-containing protein [Patescibacteria group bacterium]
MVPLKTLAIETALTGDWNTAISLNQKLLAENPDDIETLNRLAFAFSIIGKAKNAKTLYKKVLKLDTKNPIALKNLKRLSCNDFKSNVHAQSPFLARVDTMFIEESGKTKIIDLVNVAESKIITDLMTGEPLNFRIKRSKIFVLDQRDRYIGVLPDDIGKRLIKFIKGGNTYEAYVKSTENHKVIIFVKETRLAPCFKNQPSFIQGGKTKIRIQNSFSKEFENHAALSLEESEE